MNKFVRIFNKAKRQHQSLEESLHTLNEMISHHTSFKSSVVIQPGDGFCLLDEDDGIVLAPLTDAYELIKSKGTITSEDLRSIAI